MILYGSSCSPLKDDKGVSATKMGPLGARIGAECDHLGIQHHSSWTAAEL